jgi:hypothetical protein
MTSFGVVEQDIFFELWSVRRRLDQLASERLLPRGLRDDDEVTFRDLLAQEVQLLRQVRPSPGWRPRRRTGRA